MIESKRITCPETGHLEEVKLERTQLGLVVTGCSRYRDGAPKCARECARRLDRRDHMIVDDRERVLLVLANSEDDAALLAAMLAEELAEDAFTVEVADVSNHSVPPLADYDGVVIGAHVRLGRYERSMISYIRDQRDALAMMPAFFYSVGGVSVFERDMLARRVTGRTGWIPTSIATFADGGAGQRAAVRTFARQVAEEIPVAMPVSIA